MRRFTEDHARLSESVNENISSSNRPSALEGKYEQFYDHERMDAIDYIEKSRVKKELSKWTEIDDQRIACMVFEVKWYLPADLFETCFLVLVIMCHEPVSYQIKVLCEQTRELQDDLHDVWIMFNVIWFREFCGWLSYLEYEQ